MTMKASLVYDGSIPQTISLRNMDHLHFLPQYLSVFKCLNFVTSIWLHLSDNRSVPTALLVMIVTCYYNELSSFKQVPPFAIFGKQHQGDSFERDARIIPPFTVFGAKGRSTAGKREE